MQHWKMTDKSAGLENAGLQKLTDKSAAGKKCGTRSANV